jgi:hypothetical protein
MWLIFFIYSDAFVLYQSNMNSISSHLDALLSYAVLCIRLCRLAVAVDVLCR